MLGSESAIEGASADESGGRIVLVESEGSKAVDMMTVWRDWQCSDFFKCVVFVEMGRSRVEGASVFPGTVLVAEETASVAIIFFGRN